MERLDKRVEKLSRLETKTSLKEAIKQSIASVAKLATDLLTNRKEGRASLKLTTEEKQARKERQITRYGRSYREGLHSKIKEMKQNMALVEAKKEDFRRYKSFVDGIDREISKHPSITTLDKEHNPPTARQVTDKEVQIKLHLKAEMIRAQIPAEFKPLTRAERQTLTASTAVNKILQAKGEPIKIDKAVFAAPEVKPEIKPAINLRPTKAEAPPLKSAFTSKAEVQPTAKTQAEYKQPMPVKIKALEQAIAQRQAAKAEAPKPEDRKSWFTAANKKTRPMTDMIDKTIKAEGAKAPTTPERSTTQTQEKFTKAQERPERRTTYSEVREKTRAEAEIKRAKMPPEYRAEPYDRPQETTGSEQKPKMATSSTFSRATEAPNQPRPERPRMNDRFNILSNNKKTSNNERNPTEDLENEI